MRRFATHFLLSIILVGLCAFTAIGQEDKLVVVGNNSVPSEMDMNMLTSVLKGEQLRWKDGSRVSIALMKTNTPVGFSTCERLYNMTANELNKYFLALVFQGKVKAPTFFNSAAELEAYVSQTPGAIGVLQNTNAESIKVIRIDGKEKI